MSNDLAAAAAQLAAARAQLVAATDIAREAAIAADANGIPKAQIAAQLNIDRARTLHRWLAK